MAHEGDLLPDAAGMGLQEVDAADRQDIVVGVVEHQGQLSRAGRLPKASFVVENGLRVALRCGFVTCQCSESFVSQSVVSSRWIWASGLMCVANQTSARRLASKARLNRCKSGGRLALFLLESGEAHIEIRGLDVELRTTCNQRVS